MFAPLGFNILMGTADDRRKRARVIYGASDLAFQVGRELRAHGDDVLFIESDAEDAERIRTQNFQVAFVDEDLAATMRSISDTRVESFIALSANDDDNLNACRVARAHGVIHLLAFVTDPIRIPDFRGLGVQTLTPSMHRSALLALMARNSALFSLMTSTEDQRDLREFTLLNPSLNGKRLMELKFPPNTLVLAVRRRDELIVPHGTTRLSVDDHLTVIGDLDVLPNVQHWLEEA